MQLSAYANGGHLILSVKDYEAELKRVVVTAFAEALAGAADYKSNESCAAWVNAGGCIYTPDHPDTVYPDCDGGFECSAGAVSVGAIEEIDALAEASASAAAWTCGDSVAIVELEATAKALAEATAIAVSYAYASCEVDGGWSCAYAGTEIEQTARATATAYANLWAGAYTCKDTCSVGVDAVAKAVGDILVKAATDAFAAGCSGAPLPCMCMPGPITAPVLCILWEHHEI